ncbi:AAA domain-containing protein/AAA_assoc domain-containing protein [Cephalotus follicularis]|uniref:AAA domain-containing protein/AAA_assoc domain-containing protein n=1 Tax=Cephalotus follicularis TaxID=3775 RepID=A0A1Q3D0I6_CEPFO|nr:AAA domain-containing protein/AAA_assoc domain-containing protein [Cephalotus follicularis]
MFSSTSSVLSSYTTFAASAMLARTVLKEVQNITGQFIPQKLQDKILSKLGGLFQNSSSQLTVFIDEYNGFTINEIYQASVTYLSTRINPSIEQLKVSKGPREKSLSVTINKGQKIVDEFQGMQLMWEFISTETQKSYTDYEDNSRSVETSEHKSIRLSFHKRYKEKVLSNYLPFVVDKSKAIEEENKVVKLYALGNFSGDCSGSPWGSVNFDHPSTFDTLAMDPLLKKDLIADLNRFVSRRKFYRRVGKAWKRGYLLYGPPGTGKSSLIAAMANYLKFDIYDMELTSLRSNSELRRLLVSTANRSILVIEDIDCSIELENRQCGGYNQSDSQITLSGLLNFIDGLWSSTGDERIIVFTSNYKDKLDPALLRPGRMDMHIHMSHLTPCGFDTLAYNYHRIRSHSLSTEIKQLITMVEVSPAEVAEELMKSEDVDIAFNGLVEFLRWKKHMKLNEHKNEEKIGINQQETETQEIEEKDEKKVVKKKKKKRAERGKGKK